MFGSVKRVTIAGAVVVLVAVGAFYIRGSQESKPTKALSTYATADFSQQIAALESQVSKRPTPADQATLALLYVRQAKVTGNAAWYDKAEAAANASLSVQPTGNPHAKLALAETLEKRHLFAQSMAIAKEVVQEQPRNPEALTTYATIALAIGEIDEASRAVDLAVSIEPKTSVLTLRGLVLNARGRDAEADYLFRQALAAEDGKDAADSAYTRAVYARFLLTKGRYEQARELLNEALRIVPGQPLVLAISGELYLKQNEAAKAAKDFSDAFAASPQVSSLRKFSRAKRMLKDERGANDAMKAAYGLARKEIESGVHAHPLEMGYVLIAGTDPEGWKEAVTLATGELKVRRSVLPYVMLAQANEKLQNWPAATEAIDAVLRTGVRNPDYYMTAGKIAKGAGDIARARFYFEAARAEDRNLTEAEEALKALEQLPAAKVALKAE